MKKLGYSLQFKLFFQIAKFNANIDRYGVYYSDSLTAKIDYLKIKLTELKLTFISLFYAEIDTTNLFEYNFK